MAAPKKAGLDYFPLDIGIFHDSKMIPLKAQFSAEGIAVYIDILCRIYGDKGYYIEVNEDFYFFVSDETRVRINTIRQIVNFLLGRSLFDNKLFQSDKVLTSRSIQKRYQEAVTVRGKKTPVTVDSKYWLLKKEETRSFIQCTLFFEGSGKNEVIPEKNPHYSQEEPLKVKESKVKESKVKESKVKESKKEKEVVTVGKSRQSPLFSSDSFEYKASKYLRDNILSRIPNPNIPKTDEDLQKWAIHIERMKRLDSLAEEDIRNMIRFATTDTFWQTNILSTKKLREKKDTLYAQMQAKTKGKSEKQKEDNIDFSRLPKGARGLFDFLKQESEI